MYIDYSFAKVITILGLSKIEAEKKDILSSLASIYSMVLK